MLVTLTAAMVAAGCATSSRKQLPPRIRLFALPGPPTPGPSGVWPLPPEEAASIMRQCVLGALRETSAGGGAIASHRVTARCAEASREFEARWTPVPGRLNDWNNSPRHELAAYELQKLFLDPDDYIVPPSVVRCLEIATYRQFFPGAQPSITGTRCKMGNLSPWLRNVTAPDPLYDEKRFRTEPNYAHHMANFNLLTHIIDHKDGRSANFRVSTNDADRRVFAIDSSVAFDASIYNYLARNWNEIRVPALGRKSIDRLRTVTKDDVGKLGVLAEMRIDRTGVFQPAPNAENMHPRRGVRRSSDRVQFGLTRDELDDVWERIERVIYEVDSAKIPVF